MANVSILINWEKHRKKAKSETRMEKAKNVKLNVNNWQKAINVGKMS